MLTDGTIMASSYPYNYWWVVEKVTIVGKVDERMVDIVDDDELHLIVNR